jgi:hypothetical protein
MLKSYRGGLRTFTTENAGSKAQVLAVLQGNSRREILWRASWHSCEEGTIEVGRNFETSDTVRLKQRGVGVFVYCRKLERGRTTLTTRWKKGRNEFGNRMKGINWIMDMGVQSNQIDIARKEMLKILLVNSENKDSKIEKYFCTPLISHSNIDNEFLTLYKRF